MNLKTLIAVAVVAAASAAMTGCGAGVFFNQPTSDYANLTNQANPGYARGGPVGRAMMLANNNRQSVTGVPAETGQWVLANSGFHNATHPGIWAQDDAERPPLLLANGGVGPTSVTIPNGNGGDGNAPAGSPNGTAASDERVNRIAVAVTELTVDSEHTRAALVRQGETLRSIDRRLRRGSRPRATEPETVEPPAPAPATRPNSAELVTDSTGP